MTLLHETALTEWHKKQGAKMVPFAGYSMPVQYTQGVLKEHLYTREKAGLFDVSHMGQVLVTGNNTAEILETIFPANLQELSLNQQTYTLLLNEQGGIIDDLMICHRKDGFFLVLNASRKVVDLDFLQRRLGDRLSLQLQENRSLLALQGPTAHKVLKDLSVDVSALTFMQGDWLSVQGIDCFITRSGYTGEDGFEISVDNGDAGLLADLLVAHDDVQPAGLGARDSLRLEAGLCLYGHELDEEITPTDANLNWAIAKVRRSGGTREGGFIASDIVLQQMKSGGDYIRLGLVSEGRAPVRADTIIQDDKGNEVGVVTSGVYSPNLQKPVMMAKIHAQYRDEENFKVVIRNKPITLLRSTLPFVPHRYFRG